MLFIRWGIIVIIIKCSFQDILSYLILIGERLFIFLFFINSSIEVRVIKIFTLRLFELRVVTTDHCYCLEEFLLHSCVYEVSIIVFIFWRLFFIAILSSLLNFSLFLISRPSWVELYLKLSFWRKMAFLFFKKCFLFWQWCFTLHFDI